MASADAKGMIRKLQRMAASDNNKDYLDQIHYAIGNIRLAQRDTLQAIASYEEGARRSTRNGTEKGALLLQLAQLYWQREAYADARRCYSEAVGLIDTDLPHYKEVNRRSEILDQLVPLTDAVHLEDSLQRLVAMPEADRLKVIDRHIAELKNAEREAKRAQQDAEMQSQWETQNAQNNGMSLSVMIQKPPLGISTIRNLSVKVAFVLNNFGANAPTKTIGNAVIVPSYQR